MTRYEVSVWVGKVTVEVTADDEDHALDVANVTLREDGIFDDASWEVREVEQ